MSFALGSVLFMILAPDSIITQMTVAITFLDIKTLGRTNWEPPALPVGSARDVRSVGADAVAYAVDVFDD
ncbi:MAG: hypothetical protein K2Z81_04220, partial [Cyanobacteria bacterium]|nr:hypothetical protein [Cyanobacteriota bacterium]